MSYDFSDASLDQSPPASTQLDADAINRVLISTLEQWLPRLLPGGRRFAQDFRAGSTDGTKGSSLSVSLRGVNRGLWHDHATGQRGNPIQLIQAVLGCDFPAALNAASRIADLPLRPTPASRTRLSPSPDTLPAALDIAAQTIPLTPGTLAYEYLTITRGLPLTEQSSLRFHPRLYHAPTRQHYPALVAIIRRDHRTIGIHRTYLDPATGNKIPHYPARMTLGSISGGAVYLIGHSQTTHATPTTLVACEGIETALAFLALYPATPVIAATLSTSGLRNFMPPSSTTRLLIAADFDPVNPQTGRRPGTAAAEFLQERMKIPTAILYPERPHKDFDDQYNASQYKATSNPATTTG